MFVYKISIQRYMQLYKKYKQVYIANKIVQKYTKIYKYTKNFAIIQRCKI